MKVIAPGDVEIDLGITEVTPTIGIDDFSKRETDDFGVTRVVPRAFRRRMSVKFALPSDQVDTVQLALADLRAVPAQWVAAEDLDWLNLEGFYKDFSIDVANGEKSFCSLTVEGLAESETVADAGEDPAPTGASTFMLVQPVTIAGGALIASNVPETDYAEWSGATIYGLNARVIKAATHRIYESATANNLANDPAGPSGVWVDVGPTNRWAMFDEALGTVTTRNDGMAVTIAPGAVDAVALLDVVGDTVRVQKGAYDETKPVTGGAVTFLDLPGASANIIVTVAGTGAVSVGTLLVGKLVTLGITEDRPSAGITDYSRKEVDDFGDATIVERAWAKRFSANALITTGTVDIVANRIAAVRSRPSLWIGADGTDALTVYGFFKDFSIEAGQNTSKLAVSIEGLSKAAPPAAAEAPSAPPSNIAPVAPAELPEGTLWIAPDGHPYRFGSRPWTSSGAAWTSNGEPWLGGGYADVQDQIGPQAAAVAATIEAQVARIASDNWLTAGEKPGLILAYQAMVDNHTALHAKAVALGAATTERANATAAVGSLNAFLAALSPAWNNTAVDTPINGATLTALWSDAANKIALLQAAIQGLEGPQGPQGDQGDPGDEGAPGLTISASPPVLTVARTAGGAPKAGELPKGVQVQVLDGETDVTAACSYTKADTGSSWSNDGHGAFTLTALSAEDAFTVIEATYGARSIPLKIAVAQPRDGSAASRASASVTSMNATGTYAAIATVDLVVPNGATVSGSASTTYLAASFVGAGTRTVRQQAKVSIQNLTDSGSEVDGTAQIGTAASYIGGDGPSDVGQVSASANVTNSTGATKTFRLRFYIRYYDGATTAQTGGGTYTGNIEAQAA